jgi:hypothetical protein
MKQVTIETAKLAAIIVDNKNKHRDEFAQSIAGWTKETIEKLKINLDILERNSIEPMLEIESKPQSHLVDYERALQMLAVCCDDKIVIEVDEFRKLVQDDWHWKHHWVASNSKYFS